MEFLPIEINGNRIYSTFFQRLGAGLLDTIILFAIIFLSATLESSNFTLAATVRFGLPIILVAYYVIFNARYGGTIGKLLMGIQITKINGSKIGYREAFKRSSVDILLTIPALVISYVALSKVNQSDFLVVDFLAKDELLRAFHPSWEWMINRASDIWMWSEFVTLLTNKRRRALHDFIAGTIVINKAYVTTEDDSK